MFAPSAAPAVKCPHMGDVVEGSQWRILVKSSLNLPIPEKWVTDSTFPVNSKCLEDTI